VIDTKRCEVEERRTSKDNMRNVLMERKVEAMQALHEDVSFFGDLLTKKTYPRITFRFSSFDIRLVPVMMNAYIIVRVVCLFVCLFVSLFVCLRV